MIEELRKNVYTKVERLRKERGLSQEEFAEKCGFSFDSYAKNKTTNKLTLDNLALMSQGLDIKITELIKTDNEESTVDVIEQLQSDINKVIDLRKETIIKNVKD